MRLAFRYGQEIRKYVKKKNEKNKTFCEGCTRVSRQRQQDTAGRVGTTDTSSPASQTAPSPFPCLMLFQAAKKCKTWRKSTNMAKINKYLSTAEYAFQR